MKKINPDLLFSAVALSDGAGKIIGILFLLGLIAAAYSSADSALTSLTTSFSVDFLNINEKDNTSKLSRSEMIRKFVHIFMSLIIILTVIILKYKTNDSAISLLMKFAGFTYGPLIGVFFFGIITKRYINDLLVPFICFFAMGITFVLWYFSYGSPGIQNGDLGIFGTYKFGFELIILNALITFIVLFSFSNRKKEHILK